MEEDRREGVGGRLLSKMCPNNGEDMRCAGDDKHYCPPDRRLKFPIRVQDSFLPYRRWEGGRGGDEYLFATSEPSLTHLLSASPRPPAPPRSRFSRLLASEYRLRAYSKMTERETSPVPPDPPPNSPTSPPSSASVPTGPRRLRRAATTSRPGVRYRSAHPSPLNRASLVPRDRDADSTSRLTEPIRQPTQPPPAIRPCLKQESAEREPVEQDTDKEGKPTQDGLIPASLPPLSSCPPPQPIRKQVSFASSLLLYSARKPSESENQAAPATSMSHSAPESPMKTDLQDVSPDLGDRRAPALGTIHARVESRSASAP
jgi:hypothetical protein